MTLQDLIDGTQKLKESGKLQPWQHATINLTVTRNESGVSVEYGAWLTDRYFYAATLEKAITDALAYDAKQAKLYEAAKLRLEADRLEAEAA
jgi:hypothetical protein